MIRGKLTVEKFDNAMVYKWLSQFAIKNGQIVLGYGKTKDESLDDLCHKLSPKNNVDK